MPTTSTAFRVRGVAPDDVAWHVASDGDRRDFWRFVVGAVLRAKDRSLARGLDRHGLKMKPVTEYTREHRHSAMGEADPDAPPLTPAHGLSRTRAYLKGRAFADHAEFFWANGWGKVLNWHRVGARNHWARSGRLPVRDVIGLSQADEAIVRKEAGDWWKQRAAGAAREAEAERFRVVLPPLPKSPKVPRPIAAGAWQDRARKIAAASRAKYGGSFDLSRSTFGIGASQESVETAIARGLSTGFRRRGDRPRPPRAGGAIPLVPRVPRPRPTRRKLSIAAQPLGGT